MVSAGGLKFDTMTVVVGPTTHQLVLREDWRQPLSKQWFDFGDPRPGIVSGVLRVNGDESLTSGVTSLLGIDPSRGAGVRLRARIPLSIAQWQRLTVGLDPFASDDSLRAWPNRGRGLQPESWIALRQQSACVMHAPRAEGGEFVDVIDFAAAGKSVQLPRAPHVDHRFELAFDHAAGLRRRAMRAGHRQHGHRVSNIALRRDRPLRVLIEGQSVGTTVEVGAVEAWSGIRNDINWNTVQTAAPPELSAPKRKR